MIDHSFSSGQELLELCEVEQIPISEAAVLYELDRAEMDREAVMAEMRIDLEVMRESIRVGLEEQQTSITGLMGEDADKLMAFTESAVMGREMTKIVASAMAVTEVNASMGRIVAAPTAGASGILPAVLIQYGDAHDLSEDQLVAGLCNAGAGGQVGFRTGVVESGLGVGVLEAGFQLRTSWALYATLWPGW